MCGADFYPNAPNQIYDTEACKQSAENKRWYEAHKDEMKARVKARRAAKRAEELKAIEASAFRDGMEYASKLLDQGVTEIDLAPFEDTAYAKKPRPLRSAAFRSWSHGIETAAKAKRLD